MAKKPSKEEQGQREQKPRHKSSKVPNALKGRTPAQKDARELCRWQQ